MFKRSLFSQVSEDLFKGFTLTFQLRLTSLGNDGKGTFTEYGILNIQKNVGFSSLRLGLRNGKFSLILK